MKKIIIIMLIGLMLTACQQPKKKGVADMSAYKIDSDQFMVMTMEEAYDFLSTGTGYIYFGFSSCPWCKELVPIIDGEIKGKDIVIYYVDVRPNDKDIRVDDNEAYKKVVEYTKEYLLDDENGNPRLYVPQLFAVVKGKIVYSHADTVPGHDATERKMTAEEVTMLKGILTEYFNSIK